MFFGKEVSYEEQETAEIFGKYIKLFDGKDYELQNTELNTISKEVDIMFRFSFL